MENNPILNTSLNQKISPKTGSAIEFVSPKGKTIISKFKAFADWQKERDELGSWAYGKVTQGKYSLDYTLFDYLDIGRHPEILKAAHETIENYGVASCASPSQNGLTSISKKLELKTKSILKKDTCLLYPSGWSACFGAVTGMVSRQDTVLIDRLAHNCLAVAAKYATKNTVKFAHNNLKDLEEKLFASRKIDKENAIVIVLETLYSMNSTTPDLVRVMELAEQFDALVIIDVSHEWGCYGDNGMGLLNSIDPSNNRLIITGSYSKVFGTNGGFVAGHHLIEDHFVAFSPTYSFSSALAPIQCGIILKGLEIVFSEEGKMLRKKLDTLCEYFRTKLIENNFELDGDKSAIVPIIIGEEIKSREIFPKLLDRGLLVNLIEFPVAARGRSLYRLMLSPQFTFEELDKTVEILLNVQDEYAKSIKSIL